MNKHKTLKEALTETYFNWYTDLPKELQARDPQSVEWIFMDWGRRCEENNHDIMISGDRQLQCIECLYLFQGKKAWEEIVPSLRNAYGREWEARVVLLKEARKLLKQQKYSRLALTVVDYCDENGDNKTEHFFYLAKEDVHSSPSQ